MNIAATTSYGATKQTLRVKLPVSEQFGTGERYTFGTTHDDIYPLPPETTSLLFVRDRRNRLAVGDVYKVEPTETNGMHVLYVDGEIVVNPNGNYVNVPSPKVNMEQIQNIKDYYATTLLKSMHEIDEVKKPGQERIVEPASPTPIRERRYQVA